MFSLISFLLTVFALAATGPSAAEKAALMETEEKIKQLKFEGKLPEAEPGKASKPENTSFR